MIFKLARSRRLKYRVPRNLIALLFIVIWVCSPVVPVIKMPTLDSGPKLGLEVQTADAAFGNGYEYRRTITINESQVIGGNNLPNFPVLMSFTELEFRTTGNGGNVTDAQGDDIIFTSDDTGSTVLDFEIERYNATTGEVIAWVEVPTLDFNDNTPVYMFYGNAAVTSSQEDIPGTWDSNYIGVYHMDGDASTQLDSADASVSQDGSVSGATANAAGKIGPAYDFDGTNDVITVTDQAELDVTNVGTFEAWMRTDDISATEANFSSWVLRNAPAAGTGADDLSGHDSVIVGENVHYGLFLCNSTAEDFGVATSSLAGPRFDNWDMAKFTTVPAGCGDAEGGSLGVDSDGVHIYYASLAVNGTAALFSTATATPSYSAVSTWRNDTDPTASLSGAGEGSGVDMTINNGTAYYDLVLLTGTSEVFASTSRALGSGAAVSWQHGAANTPSFGGAGNENCTVSSGSDGYSLHRAIFCSDGAAPEENYTTSSTTIGVTTPLTWRTQTASAGAGTADFNGVAITLMGGQIYHFSALHTDATETYQTAMSSQAIGGALSWTTRAGPDGTSANDTITASVVSDGKNLFYSTFIASSTVPRFYTASSTLPAHPFISKRNAYEAIQVGTGFAFDWAGRPYTFGTSTNTTGFKHVAVTQDGTTLNMYENGVLKRTQQTTVDFESNANNLLIGAGNRSDGASIFFNGVIDEVRISNDDRTADWIATQYNNQNATSTFYTLGAAETFASTVVETGFASNIKDTMATLFGTIVSGVGITQHGFATSTSPAFPLASSATTTLGAGSVGEFSGTVTGLSANTTYYFRAYATNGGTTYGTTRSFFTGNSTATRSVRLFEGYSLRFYNGDMVLYQQKP